LQLGVFGSGGDQDGNVGVGVFLQREKIFVGCERLNAGSGLPALRNVQPGVPPVGAFSDYVVFIWAELIVAVSAVVTVWPWPLRTRPASEP
jgi:hypothetical protein